MYKRTNARKDLFLVKRALNPAHLLIVFGVLIKNRTLFLKVRNNFTSDLLNYPGEEFHASFLKMIVEYFDGYGDMPVQQVAVAEMISLSKEASAGFSEVMVRDEIAAIYGLTEGADDEKVRATENMATDLITEILIQRKVVNPTKSLLLNSGDDTLANPSEFLSEATQNLHEIQSMMSRTIISSVPQIRPRIHNYVEFDHDMEFMNAITKGGLPRKSVSGLFGPFGGCKTTTATQAAASRINIEWRKHQRGEPAEIVVYANCEGSPEEISFRVLSFLAKIPARDVRSHFYAIRPLRDHVPSDPEDYNNKFGMTVPETVRLAEACEKIDKFLKIIDLSGGTEASSGIGKGFVNDLVMSVDSYCRESTRNVSLFILDYGKAFVRRFMDLNGMAAENIRFYLGRLPDLIRRDIADKFDCAALVLQQMNKTANTKKPGQLLTHGDSSEASDFGENCWFCFALSVPYKSDDGAMITNLNMSKARDVEPPRKMPSLEYIPYCQGLRLRDDFRIVNNTLIYEERRNIVMPTMAMPARRSSRGASGGPATAADMNPL